MKNVLIIMVKLGLVSPILHLTSKLFVVIWRTKADLILVSSNHPMHVDYLIVVSRKKLKEI